MTGPRALLLDLDNTLYDFEAAYARGLRRIDQLASAVGCGGARASQLYRRFRDQHPPAQADSGRRSRQLRMEELIAALPQLRHCANAAVWAAEFEAALLEDLQPAPGVAAALALLRERMPLLVVTEGWHDNQTRVLEKLGFAGLGLQLLASYSCKVAKRDGSAYQLALEWLGTPAASTIMVGDHWDWDVLAAARLGMPTIWISLRPPCAGTPPGFIGTAASLAEVPALLEQA